MKNICITFLIVAIIILSAVAISLPAPTHTEYLRIHIRANSNLEADQSVKYKVKEAVVEYLTPFIAECDTKQKAQAMLNDKLNGIEKVADSVLEISGFSYTSRASVREENFPTRVYGELTLDGGFYDALIVELGSGEGDNWWCVVYPPLCFTGEGTSYKYRSKIADIINDFIRREQ